MANNYTFFHIYLPVTSTLFNLKYSFIHDLLEYLFSYPMNQSTMEYLVFGRPQTHFHMKSQHREMVNNYKFFHIYSPVSSRLFNLKISIIHGLLEYLFSYPMNQSPMEYLVFGRPQTHFHMKSQHREMVNNYTFFHVYWPVISKLFNLIFSIIHGLLESLCS